MNRTLCPGFSNAGCVRQFRGLEQFCTDARSAQKSSARTRVGVHAHHCGG